MTRVVAESLDIYNRLEGSVDEAVAQLTELKAKGFTDLVWERDYDDVWCLSAVRWRDETPEEIKRREEFEQYNYRRTLEYERKQYEELKKKFEA